MKSVLAAGQGVNHKQQEKQLPEIAAKQARFPCRFCRHAVELSLAIRPMNPLQSDAGDF